MPSPSGAGSSPLVRGGVVCFALGLIAVAVVFGMFAAGAHDLPLWLNLAAMLSPVGFGLALIGLFRQARRSGRRRAAPTTPAGSTA
jgi:ABC-type multidrug transport system permease subunit